MEAVQIGPVRVRKMTTDSAVAAIEDAIARDGEPLQVAFCNAHTAAIALKDPEFVACLDDMLVLNDGVGMDIASLVLSGAAFPANLNGTDFVPLLLKTAHKPLRIFLLGGQPEVIARAAANLRAAYPRHHFVGFRDGFFDRASFPDLALQIAGLRVDLVLCGMGNPLQEFTVRRLAQYDVSPVLLGVGAFFDFVSETVPRAPAWVRKMRLEFVYRLLLEPRRLGDRYTRGSAAFLYSVARQWLTQTRATPQVTGARTPPTAAPSSTTTFAYSGPDRHVDTSRDGRALPVERRAKANAPV